MLSCIYRQYQWNFHQDKMSRKFASLALQYRCCYCCCWCWTWTFSFSDSYPPIAFCDASVSIKDCMWCRFAESNNRYQHLQLCVIYTSNGLSATKLVLMVLFFEQRCLSTTDCDSGIVEQFYSLLKHCWMHQKESVRYIDSWECLYQLKTIWTLITLTRMAPISQTSA